MKMGIIGVIFLVVFVLICLLLICIVLIQNEEGGGMGGLFGDANSKAFGSRSGNMLTRTTYVLVTLFFVTTFILGFLNKAPETKQLDPSVLETPSAVTPGSSWLDDDTGFQEAPGSTEAAEYLPTEAPETVQ
jgi:preprotein translocase subunit SecG